MGRTKGTPPTPPRPREIKEGRLPGQRVPDWAVALTIVGAVIVWVWST